MAVPTGGKPKSRQLPVLQDRLVLNRFFCRLLGFDDFRGLREWLCKVQQGAADDGHSSFARALEELQGLQLPRDQLAAYDLRIMGYMELLNRFRTPPVSLLYFQYLAVLFAEMYLDRLFNDKVAFLRELNDFVREENEGQLSVLRHYREFTDDKLSKVAFGMATGSGKTLIMHINLWQYLHYSASSTQHDNILLITPNEGLSRQHLEEFRKSGILAAHHPEAGGTLFDYGDTPVTVIEITKLPESKRGGGVTVEVDAFGPNNLLFVDEGHRGASGEQWRAVRARVAERGFTFEYSATFRQIVNGASPNRRSALLEEYSKAILFEYSYPHFYHDGYGKDYAILNLKDETDTFDDWMLLGNLLSFYEQCLVYEERREAFHPYNLERPLWVFVGHSVTGGKTQNDKASLTDVEEIIAFFADFLNNKAKWAVRIDKALRGETGLKNPRDEDVFGDLFRHLREKGLTGTNVYDDIVRCVFHSKPGETLRAVELKIAPGEIGLRAGADNPYFGVTNIGDVAGLIKLLVAQGLPCEEENISGSLFDRINEAESAVNVLIGSRKFMEGWDSFRVSSMGLMNIGKTEGAQVVQLFGRGVRLWGRERSLKRSAALEPHSAPPHIGLLETLNVFGVRANYMAQFRELLKQEGVSTDFEEVTIPVRVQDEFLEHDLQVLRLPYGRTFQEEDGVALAAKPDIRVTLDLLPRLELAKSGTGEEVLGKASGEDKSDELKKVVSLLNWERIYCRLLATKQAKGLRNLGLTQATLRAVVAEGNYTLLCPDGRLPLRMFADLRRAEDIAVAVLAKYIAAFYDRRRREWELERLRLLPLDGGDLNLAFAGYEVRATANFAAIIRDLVRKADEIYKEDVASFPNIHFDRHLYQPLLVSDPRIEAISPPGLNEGEKKFVEDLRHYLQQSPPDLSGKELFLLRNLTRGKGIGFFEASEGETFYPDFILWLIGDGQQSIAFIDPHGLRQARGLKDPKIQLHELLRQMGARLQSQCPNWIVHVTSFIIAPGSYQELAKTSWVRDYTKEKFEKHHVLFGEGDYIAILLQATCPAPVSE